MTDPIDVAIRATDPLDPRPGLLAGPPPHEHEWEASYVIERLTGADEGDARVWRCLECGEIKEYSEVSLR